MSVQQLLSQLNGKDEAASLQIAQRVGEHLCDDFLSEADRRAAELLARAMAEDAIETVRCALSKSIGHAKHLPRDLALKIAHDVDSVACPFLEITEVFSESDWQQILLTISRGARMAVARRSSLSEGIANSLVQIGDTMVAETLIENPAAPMTGTVCYTILDRFSSEIWVLDKLAHRDDLVSEIAVTLTAVVSAAAREKLAKTYKIPEKTEPLAKEAETSALFKIVQQTPKEDLVAIAEEMHKRGKLTPSLVMVSLQENRLDFLEVALSVLAERSREHVRSVILRAGWDAVKQLLGRAKIPDGWHKEIWKELEFVRQTQK
jgi:uncharacterized protein (DUF2336 family)